MTSKLATQLCHIFLAACIALSHMAMAENPPTSPTVTAASPDLQAYVVETAKTSEGRLFLAPAEPTEGQHAEGRLRVRGSVLSRTITGDRSLLFTVEMAERAPVFSIDLTVAVEPGSAPFDFDWPMGAAGEGDYIARLRVVDPTLGEEAKVEWRVYLRSAAAVAARVESAREEVARSQDAATDTIPPYSRQRLVLALESLAPFPSNDRPLVEADSNARFAALTAMQVRAQLAFGTGKRLPVERGPSGDHGFPFPTDSGRMLGGVALGGRPGVAPSWPADGGATPARTEFPSMVWLSTVGDVARPRTSDELKAAVSAGRVVAVSLWTAPKAAPAGPESRGEFRQYLTGVYRDRVELSRAWKRNLSGFDEADLWPEVTNRAYQCDVQSFQRQRMTRWVSDQVRSAEESVAPAAATVTFTESIFKPGEARTEPDAEALAATLPVLSVRVAGPLADPRYAQRFPGAQLMYALFHSFAPGRPLVAQLSLDYGVNDRLRMDSMAQLRTAAVEAAVEGVTALAVEFPGLADPVSGAPEALAGFAAALHEMRGADEAIAAYRTADAPVAILWSDSSRLLENGAAHLSALMNAYEGCSFGGQKIGFLTERQLANGQWHGVKVVVLPDVVALGAEARAGLESLIATGVGVIRTESSPVYDEHGRALGRVLSAGANSVLVRGHRQPHEYLDALDEFMVRGVLPDVPRAITGSGYPIEGVKTRYVENGAAHFLYILSLRKEPVLCRFSRDIGGATSLLTGRRVVFPCTVNPLDPILLRIAPETAAN
jgi:hypothetical protein